jgi:hypothetical protein
MPSNCSNAIDVAGFLCKYESYQEKICEIDAAYLADHNKRYTEKHNYHLHSEIKPCPFEGDLLKAKVILLLANPHFQKNESTAKDHERLDGWGVWGLSSQSHHSMHGWWRPRLKNFINNIHDEDEWKELSWKVASFQTVAWASVNFHECNQLPSKKLMAETLRNLAKKRNDVVFVVMRNKAYWSKVLCGINVRTIYIKNPRCSFLTPNNMHNPSDWEFLEASVKSSTE